MPVTSQQPSGFFEIAREPSSITFEAFSESYLVPEKPVVIEGVGNDWLARQRWTESYLRERLAQESSASAASLWYWMDRDTLNEDYSTPEFVSQCLDAPSTFPRNQHNRIWVNKKEDMSSWHYDGGIVNVFNVQVKGRKEWFLVSPDTPLDCYPFTNFCIIDGKSDDERFADKIHTRFFLNEGDMVYIPPVWFHKVISCEKENINLNWLFTKKATAATSATLKREVERYMINDYLTQHRFRWVRQFAQQFNRQAPGYMRINWRYDKPIETPYQISKWELLARFAKELGRLGKTILHANKIKPYTKTLSTPKRLQKST